MVGSPVVLRNNGTSALDYSAPLQALDGHSFWKSKAAQLLDGLATGVWRSNLPARLLIEFRWNPKSSFGGIQKTLVDSALGLSVPLTLIARADEVIE